MHPKNRGLEEECMEKIKSLRGITISFDRFGRGPALVLVHGSFSTHDTNWEFVKPLLQDQLTICAIARRGRGQTDATVAHSMEDEVDDLVAVIRTLPAPVF